MCSPGQAGVEAHLLHLVGTSQEEVDDPVSDDTVWEALDVVVIALADVNAVPLLTPRLHADLLTERSGVAGDLPHSAPYLRTGRGTLDHTKTSQRSIRSQR